MSESYADLESEINRLYSLPLSSFVTARNQLASRLRNEKRRQEASRVKALAKPSLSAWCVNQLYWKRRPMWQGLVRAGGKLRQAAGKPSQHTELMRNRRRALDNLIRESDAILAEGGHAAAALTRKQVHDTLEAVSLYGDQLPGESAGRLTQALDPPGFEALLSLSSTPPPPRRKDRSETPQPAPSPRKTTTASLRRARARLASAEREAARKRRELQQAESRAVELEQRATRLQSETQRLEQQLNELREQLSAESAEARRARKAADAARAALTRAEQARVAALDKVERR